MERFLYGILNSFVVDIIAVVGSILLIVLMIIIGRIKNKKKRK